MGNPNETLDIEPAPEWIHLSRGKPKGSWEYNGCWGIFPFPADTGNVDYVRADKLNEKERQIESLEAQLAQAEDYARETAAGFAEVRAQVDKLINSEFVCSRCGSQKKDNGQPSAVSRKAAAKEVVINDEELDRADNPRLHHGINTE